MGRGPHFHSGPDRPQQEPSHHSQQRTNPQLQIGWLPAMSPADPGGPGLTCFLCTFISSFSHPSFPPTGRCSSVFAWFFQQRGMQPHQNCSPRPKPSDMPLPLSSPSPAPSPRNGLPAQHGPPGLAVPAPTPQRSPGTWAPWGPANLLFYCT